MTIFIFTLISFIAICLLLILCVSIYNKYQDYIIRINESEANIDAILRKRFDLLSKATSIIKSNTKTKDNVLEMVYYKKLEKENTMKSQALEEKRNQKQQEKENFSL